MESSMKLLWHCSRTLEPDRHTNKLLKSYYMRTCRTIAKFNEEAVLKDRFTASQMCPHCLQFWCENEFDMKLRPQQLARSSKAKKLIGKLEASQAGKGQLLTRSQRKRAKWLKKKVTKKLIIKCSFCQHKSEIALEKPKAKPAKDATTLKEEEPVELTPATKKKKSKAKDRTAGLKIAVLPKNTKVTSNTAAAKQSSPASATPKPSPALSTPLKAKKKKKNKGTQQATPVAPKIQSKTQQKNSLLQLAALLKTQTTKPKGAPNRLEALMQ